MKKRIIVLLVACALFSGGAFGQSIARDGVLVAPGALNAMVGVGSGFIGSGIVGGLEYPIGKFVLAELPFTYGVGARAQINFNFGSFYVGAVGTLHFSLAALNPSDGAEWLGNIDLYTGLGLAIIPHVGFGGFGGLSYYLSRNLAIYAEGGNASGIGVLFKL